jgi:hypothetical protein
MPANQITYTATLDSINTSNPVLKFPKFDPSTGNLNCVGMNYTITSILSFDLANWLHIPFTYQFDYSQYTGVNDGNGLFVDHNVTHTYGPYNLADTGQPGSTVHMGPDTLFNAASYSALNNTNTAPYQSGIPNDSTSVTYDNTYSIHYTSSSSAFALSLLGYAKGSFTLTYYWCPNVALATSVTDFTAVGDGDYITLKWTGTNESNNTNYEIEYSNNGRPFQAIGSVKNDATASGTSAKYQYQYPLNPSDVGKLYFRIRRTDANGNITYTEVLIITLGAGENAAGGVMGTDGYQTYPNPATSNLIFQFNENQTGRYLLELVNTAGQVVLQKPATLTGTSQIRLDLNPKPVKGLYFLRTTDINRGQHYTSKVFIN